MLTVLAGLEREEDGGVLVWCLLVLHPSMQNWALLLACHQGCQHHTESSQLQHSHTAADLAPPNNRSFQRQTGQLQLLRSYHQQVVREAVRIGLSPEDVRLDDCSPITSTTWARIVVRWPHNRIVHCHSSCIGNSWVSAAGDFGVFRTGFDHTVLQDIRIASGGTSGQLIPASPPDTPPLPLVQCKLLGQGREQGNATTAGHVGGSSSQLMHVQGIASDSFLVGRSRKRRCWQHCRHGVPLSIPPRARQKRPN